MAIKLPSGVLRFSELRQTLTPKYSNAKASWFVHDNAAIVEFHSKANALDKDSMDVIRHALEQAQVLKLRGVVLHNDAQHFSCGVNLTAFRGFFEAEDYAGMDHFLNHFQQTMHAINRCTLPVIAAPAGMSIGGGFEVVLAADHVIGHSNCVMGLVESSVGVVPGGGGCKEYLYRWYEVLGDIKAAAWKAFMIVGYGWTDKSPIEATEQAMLYPEDQYMMNRDRLLSEALSQLDNVKKAKPRKPLPMAGEETYREMMDWLFEAHDHSAHDEHDDHDDHDDHKDHDDHDDHDDHKDHDDHDDHGHGAHDPHAWLSPENAKLWLNIIASKLSVADPENAASYFTNAAAGQAEIEDMVAEVSATLKPVQGGKFVVFHDAYQYFENDFDFYASGAISLSDASDPSPARIAKVQRRIRDEGIQCVLAEPQFNQGLVATVMEGSNATASVIDPLGADIKPGPKLYTQLIKNMAKTLRDCL